MKNTDVQFNVEMLYARKTKSAMIGCIAPEECVGTMCMFEDLDTANKQCMVAITVCRDNVMTKPVVLILKGASKDLFSKVKSAYNRIRSIHRINQ